MKPISRSLPTLHEIKVYVDYLCGKETKCDGTNPDVCMILALFKNNIDDMVYFLRNGANVDCSISSIKPILICISIQLCKRQNTKKLYLELMKLINII
jgi:hypothetical protein